jgi:hypothetical protein
MVVQSRSPNVLHNLFELLNAEIPSLDGKMKDCLNLQKGYDDKAIMLSSAQWLGALHHLQALGNERAGVLP